MKRLIVILLLALLAVNAGALKQIDALQAHLFHTETSVQTQEPLSCDITSLLAKTSGLLNQAHLALQHSNVNHARDLVQEAADRADAIRRTVTDQANPTFTWLRAQIKNLQDQIDRVQS